MIKWKKTQFGIGRGRFAIGGVLDASADATGFANGTTVETTLKSIVLPVGTFRKPGDAVRVKAWGSLAANGNTKTVKGYFGSATPFTQSGAINNKIFAMDFWVICSGSKKQQAWGTGFWNDAIIAQAISDLTQDDTADILIKVTGQSGTASNDVLLKGYIVLACPVG